MALSTSGKVSLAEHRLHDATTLSQRLLCVNQCSTIYQNHSQLAIVLVVLDS